MIPITCFPDQAADTGYNFYSDIELVDDGSMVLSGQRHIWDSANVGPAQFRSHGVIAKYRPDGAQIWLRNYRHPEVPDEFSSKHLLFDVDPTPDGGFVAAGWLNPSNNNTQDTWMIKVDSFGCLVPGCQITSVPKIESSIAQLKIYPNPANELMHFDITPNKADALSGVEGYELSLYDMLGRLVLSQTLYPFENTVNVGRLKSGVYNYRLNETWGSIVIE
ncbi:MAG: hypothetical protein ACI8SA_001470 [Dokdonia sp.]|jgi:hypothetical protein